MDISRRNVLQASAVAGGVMLVDGHTTAAMAAPKPLKKWVDPLAVPPVVTAAPGSVLEIWMERGTHRFHSGLAASATLAYRCQSGDVLDAGSPSAAGYLGPTIVATTGQPLTVKMVNKIKATGGHPLPLDLSIHGVETADQSDPRTTAHLHGGNTRPLHDGGPEDVFRDEHVYEYDNTQDATGIWYHDHALGITRVNVYAGLAGGYLVRDTADTGIDTGNPDTSPLPTGTYEVPLIIQDKSFDPVTGQQLYDGGTWVPEFFGDTPVVNGIAWPFLPVDKGVYRFRVYNGSNARFYRMGLKVKSTGAALPFFQIGSDGGLLNSPVALTQLVLGPGERADLLVDFGGLATNELVEVGNNAPTPFPNGPRAFVRGGAPLPQVIQFRVTDKAGFTPAAPIAGMTLRPVTPIVRLDPADAVRTRTHSLVEIMGPNGPVMALLNNRMFHDDEEEYAADDQLVRPHTLEVWEFVNTTVDAHPIHLHLVQFQVLNRQPVDAVAYLASTGYDVAPVDGMLMENEVGQGLYPAPPPTLAHLIGPAQAPAANEMGWKDTVVVPPGMVTRILVPFGQLHDEDGNPRLDPITGRPLFPLAAHEVHVPDHEAGENDYVWHCHILEHEEKDMMQYYRIGTPPAAP